MNRKVLYNISRMVSFLSGMFQGRSKSYEANDAIVSFFILNEVHAFRNVYIQDMRAYSPGSYDLKSVALPVVIHARNRAA